MLKISTDYQTKYPKENYNNEIYMFTNKCQINSFADESINSLWIHVKKHTTIHKLYPIFHGDKTLLMFSQNERCQTSGTKMNKEYDKYRENTT